MGVKIASISHIFFFYYNKKTEIPLQNRKNTTL